MTTDKATPRPWARNINGKYPIYAECDHRKVACVLPIGGTVLNDEVSANLELIVRAVNAHDELVEALEETVMDLKDWVSDCNLEPETSRVLNKAYAALAKARGEG